MTPKKARTTDLQLEAEKILKDNAAKLEQQLARVARKAKKKLKLDQPMLAEDFKLEGEA